MRPERRDAGAGRLTPSSDDSRRSLALPGIVLGIGLGGNQDERPTERRAVLHVKSLPEREREHRSMEKETNNLQNTKKKGISLRPAIFCHRAVWI